MAKGRRSPSRLDKRREAEAVEAKELREKEEGDEEATEEEGDEDADAEADVDAEAELEGEGDDGDEDGVKKKKTKKKAVKKAAAPKKPASKRSRAAKEVRRKAVWIVYDNASKKIETFPFNQKAEAEALLAKKIEEKKGTFYLNLVKEAIED